MNEFNRLFKLYTEKTAFGMDETPSDLHKRLNLQQVGITGKQFSDARKAGKENSRKSPDTEEEPLVCPHCRNIFRPCDVR